MDKAHPVTIFLLRHGYLVRGFAIGIILCTMLKTGFLNLGEAPAEAHSKGLYFGIFLLGSFASAAGSFVFAPLWQKITPIKNRVTYFEDEIVFIGSTMVGLSASLFFWGITSISEGLQISFWSVLAATPVFFLVWLTKATLTPLDTIDTSEANAAAQTFRAETPHFWNNALAYVISGIITALILTLSLILIIRFKGGSFAVGSGCLSFISITLMNTLAAPLFIWIGRKFRPRDTSPNGLHLSIGAVVFLTVIVALNAPVIFKNGTDLQGVLGAWHFGVAYCLMVLSYVGGGIAFSKLYKPKPISFEFT